MFLTVKYGDSFFCKRKNYHHRSKIAMQKRPPLEQVDDVVHGSKLGHLLVTHGRAHHRHGVDEEPRERANIKGVVLRLLFQ